MSDLDATYRRLADGTATEPPPRWFLGRLQHLALDATRSGDPAERLAALRVAASLGVERCLAVTRELLRDPDARVRRYAFGQAVAARGAGLGLLRQVAEGPDRALAVEALGLLALVADRGAVHVARRLLRAADPAVVVAALAVVGRVGGTSARPELARQLDHPVEAVRVAAREALARIDGGVVEPPGQWWDDAAAAVLPAPPADAGSVDASDRDALVGVPSADDLPIADAPAHDALVAPAAPSADDLPIADSPDHDALVAPAAPSADDLPIAGDADGHALVAPAARELPSADDVDPIDGCALPARLPTEPRALLRLLGLIAVDQRAVVVDALRPHATEVADLLARYRPGGDEALGRGLALAVGALGAASWLTRARPLLQAPQARVRASALAAYAAHGSSASVPLLATALGDADPDVRVAAIHAVAEVCARFRQKRLGQDRIAPLARDVDPNVRAAAEEAVRRLA